MARWTSLDEIAEEAHRTAVEKGFWENPRSIGEVIALCHSELSEWLECERNGTAMMPSTHKLPEDHPLNIGRFLSNREEEIADLMIRLLDYVGANSSVIDLDFAIEYKMAFNATRPHKHGKKF